METHVSHLRLGRIFDPDVKADGLPGEKRAEFDDDGHPGFGWTLCHASRSHAAEGRQAEQEQQARSPIREMECQGSRSNGYCAPRARDRADRGMIFGLPPVMQSKRSRWGSRDSVFGVHRASCPCTFRRPVDRSKADTIRHWC